MRYSIQHVLEGIQHDRKARLKKVGQEHEELLKEWAAARETRAHQPNLAAAKLRELAEEAGRKSTFDRDDLREVEQAMYKVYHQAPTQYAVSQLEAKAKAKADEYLRLEGLTNTQDSPLEVFLRALQSGGETHISQHGLKQAGFGDHTVSRYIVARINALGPQDG